ncbi:MAG: hypothetical protein V4773_06865 [Verrucomicrobiota bacterium]
MISPDATSRATDTPTPRGLAAWPRVAIAVVALVTALAGFGWTLSGYFLGDDFGYVGRFHDFPVLQWPRLFVESWAGDMWKFQLRELRPMTALSFIVDAHLWGGNATGYRITNLLLHSFCAAMVGWLAWRATSRNAVCGAVAAILFALHPVHAEPVQWITGRVDVLATTFYLAGFSAFLAFRDTGRWRWCAVFAGCYFGAAFAKEFGLTLPLMCIAADVLWLTNRERCRAWQTWAPYAAAVTFVVGYYFCRSTAFGPGGAGAALPDFASLEFQEKLAQRQLTYFGHLFPPLERWWFENAPAFKPGALRTFCFVIAGAFTGMALWRWVARWRPVEERRAGLFFGLGWYLVATLPLIVTYISPRHLYLASAGVCVAVAMLLYTLVRARVALVVVALAVGAFFVSKLKITMRPWHEASVLSGEITEEIRRLTPQLTPGGALLVDVPEIRNGAYVWTWAIPFVLRPPFIDERWDDRLVVLESRGQYVDWERWHEQPAVKELPGVTKPSWIVQAREEIPLRHVPVPMARLRAAAEKFAASPIKEDPHGPWRRMVDELTAPGP